MKPTYRSWAGNLRMFSDLTLGLSFKVKRWFTGFGELSFRGIQICISSPMRRSSCYMHFYIIISPDESRGYIGFRSVAPPPPPPP